MAGLAGKENETAQKRRTASRSIRRIAASKTPRMPITLACPACQAPLASEESGRRRCSAGHEFACPNGVPVLLDPAEGWEASAIAAGFEAQYTQVEEPWSYTHRGAEILKYEFVLATARQLVGGTLQGCGVADLGCSLGKLTVALAREGADVLAVDISPTAIRKSREAFDPIRDSVPGSAIFAVASSTRIPVAPGSLDLVILSDGLRSWGLSPDQRGACLATTRAALKPGGAALFLDYMTPRHFASFVAGIDGPILRVERVHYLGDRLFYKIESGLTHLGLLPRMGLARRLVASEAVARGLRAVSRLGGRFGAKHICVIARPK